MSEETEVMDNEQIPMDIHSMIQHAMDQEYTQANNIFSDLMTVKMNDLLDQEQIRIADTIYNGVEDEDDDDELGDEDGDDQLELDLEGEGEVEEEEELDDEDEDNLE